MDRREFVKGSMAAAALASPLLAGTSAAGTASGSGAGDEAARANAELAALLADIERDYIGTQRGMRDAAERAAGRYFVANALHHGFQFWFEADPQRPMFYRWFTPTKKLLGDNPDAVYYGSVIDPSREYRIRGNIHGATYTSFTIEAGTKGGGMSRRLVSAINDTEFDVAPDGSYELILSSKPRGAQLASPRTRRGQRHHAPLLRMGAQCRRGSHAPRSDLDRAARRSRTRRADG